MLRRLLSHRMYTPITIDCRRLSSDPSAILSMMGNILNVGKGMIIFLSIFLQSDIVI